jgi:hypothetical protein
VHGQAGRARTLKFDLLRSLLQRCGKLEAYFLAKLVLKKAGFGFDYEGPLLARALGERFGARRGPRGARRSRSPTRST